MEKTSEKKLTVQQPKTVYMGEAEALIAQAIDKAVPVETMEKLMAMRRELRAEKAKEAFDHDLALLQANLPVIEKKEKAGSGGFTYNFAPLEYIVEKTKKLISKYGFSYTFDTDQTDEFMTIYCKVKHKAGHTEISKFKLGIDKSARMNTSQQYGAALTYGKRYSFCAAFGIVVGGEDKDAALPTPSESKVALKPAPQLLTYEQQKKIFAVLADKDMTKARLDDYINRKYGKDSLSKLTVAQASELIEKLVSLPASKPIEDDKATGAVGSLETADEIPGVDQVKEEEAFAEEVDAAVK